MNAWKKITIDSNITSIQKVDVKEKVYEVLKYITKFSELPDDKRLELHIRTKNFRFLRKWWVLNGVPVTDDSVVDFQPEKVKEYEVLIPTKRDRNKEKYIIDSEAVLNYNTSWWYINEEMESYASNVVNLLKSLEKN